MTWKEAIQKDSQRHLYVKSVITSGTTQYFLKIPIKKGIKVVRAETQVRAQDCSVILYTELRQYNGCPCKKSIVVTAQFLRN